MMVALILFPLAQDLRDEGKTLTQNGLNRSPFTDRQWPTQIVAQLQMGIDPQTMINRCRQILR